MNSLLINFNTHTTTELEQSQKEPTFRVIHPASVNTTKRIERDVQID